MVSNNLAIFDALIQRGFFVHAISRSHNDTIFKFLFKSRNSGQEREKLQKIEYLKNQKSSLGKIKSIFNIF